MFTLGLAFIILSTVVSFFMVGYAVCQESEGLLFSGIGLFVLVCLAVSIRSDQIDRDKKYKLCVEQGKQVVKIFDTEVCKL